MFFNIYSDDKSVRVRTTNMPTFCIALHDGNEYEDVYFSQDEQASIDQDMFDKDGFDYVRQVYVNESPDNIETVRFNEETNRFERVCEAEPNPNAWQFTCVRR